MNKTGDAERLLFVTLFARTAKNHPSQLIYGTQTDGDSHVVFPWDELGFGDSKQ